MQEKVSMIIPCYNKARYMRRLFTSILDQKWNNIELIFVNDGSTDGTHELLTKYDGIFRQRGFEAIIVDQENQGLPAAVHSGLKRITGEYVCQVDADDELDPEYVSAMAGWLRDHEEYDWVVCDLLWVLEDGSASHEKYLDSYLHSNIPEEILLRNYDISFLLGAVHDTVHEYMVRSDYIRSASLIENYHFETRRTQEPQWILPLAVMKGKLKYMGKPLYHYMQNQDMMSIRNTPEMHMEYHKDYVLAIENTIKKMNIHPAKKNELLAVLSIRDRIVFMLNALWKESSVEARAYFVEARAYFKKFLNAYSSTDLNDDQPVDLDVAEKTGFMKFSDFVSKMILAGKKTAPDGRIIAYAAFGRAAARILPLLLKSDLRPHIFWDIQACRDSEIDGIPVVPPRFDSLTAGDTMLILLRSRPIIEDVEEQLTAAAASPDIWHFDDVQEYLAFF